MLDAWIPSTAVCFTVFWDVSACKMGNSPRSLSQEPIRSNPNGYQPTQVFYDNDYRGQYE